MENMRRAAICWALVIAAPLSACASPFIERDTRTDAAGPSKDLAARPSTISGSKKGRSQDADTGGGRGNRSGTNPPPSSGADPDGPLEEAPRGVDDFTVIASLSDPAGDLGPDVPSFADLVRITIGDDGTRARITVDVAGALPARTARAEVEGIGVDLYRDSDDYQLFASGETTGWFGYLYAPQGFVPYEGDFEIEQERVIFTVPWTAIGGRGSGEFGVFLEWSGPRGRYSQDLAPESGRAVFGS